MRLEAGELTCVSRDLTYIRWRESPSRWQTELTLNFWFARRSPEISGSREAAACHAPLSHFIASCVALSSQTRVVRFRAPFRVYSHQPV